MANGCPTIQSPLPVHTLVKNFRDFPYLDFFVTFSRSNWPPSKHLQGVWRYQLSIIRIAKLGARSACRESDSRNLCIPWHLLLDPGGWTGRTSKASGSCQLPQSVKVTLARLPLHRR